MSGDTLTRIVCFVRHAETSWNLGGRVQGHRNTALSALGLLQSRSLGQCLARQPWDAVYSSDLTRALQTAAAVSHHTGIPIRVLPGLRERGQGMLEGLPGDDVMGLGYDLDGPQVAREPREVFEQRCWAALRRVMSSTVEHRVVVVTHGGVIRACRDSLGVALAAGDDSPESASISVLDMTSDPHWTHYNATDHLGRWRSSAASPTIQKLMASGGEPA